MSADEAAAGGLSEAFVHQQARVISEELSGTSMRATQASHTLCQYVLENVLLHQAAAQQLQGTTTGLVNAGQQLLATSRQMAPRLSQLQAMADAAKQLRAQAEQLKQLSSSCTFMQPQAQAEEPANATGS